MKIDELRALLEQATSVCPQCRGSGQVLTPHFDDPATDHMRTCLPCKGRGTIGPTADDARAMLPYFAALLDCADMLREIIKGDFTVPWSLSDACYALARLDAIGQGGSGD